MPTEAQPDAGLTLRGPSEFVRSRVHWPRHGSDCAPIAVYLPDPDAIVELAEVLCRDLGWLVLALRTDDLEVATIAVEWAAEHGWSLGADPERLIVAGGRLAAAAAVHARDEGWPAVAHQVLIGPGLAEEATVCLAGVAPATVVDDPVYAARLRLAGVAVEELSAREPVGPALIRALR